MELLIALALVIVLIFLYVKLWSWIGGKVGGIIGQIAESYRSNRQNAIGNKQKAMINLNKSVKRNPDEATNTKFDKLLEEILRRKNNK